MFALYLGLTIASMAVVEALFDGVARRLAAAIAILATGLLAAWLPARYLDRRPFADLGLQVDRRAAADVAIGALLGLVLTGGVLLAYLAVGWAAIVDWRVGDDSGFPASFAVLMLSYASVAVLEELLFRGYLIVNLREGSDRLGRIRRPRWLAARADRLPILVAVVGSSVVFAQFHGEQLTGWQFLHFTLAGILLAIPYIVTGRLGLSIGLHWTFNVGATGLVNIEGGDHGDRPRPRWSHRSGATAGRPTIVAVVGLAVALLAGPEAAAADASVARFTDHLDDRVPRLMQRYAVPGVAIATVHDGAVTATRTYGSADPADGRALEPSTLMRVESLSKPVAASTVLQLVDVGEIALDDTVASHVSDWPLTDAGDGAEAITVRQLLAHRSGLRLGTIGLEYGPHDPLPSLREHLAHEARMVQSPDEGFLYSNPGYDLVQLLVEEVTDTDFATTATDVVLAPLGMRDASFEWTDERGRRLATGHDLAGSPVAPYVYATDASGDLVATVDDMGRFAAALATVHDGSDDAIPGMDGLLTPTGPLAGPYRAVAQRHGMGVFLETLPDGRGAAFAGGQGHGWMSHLHVVPDTGHGIVILTNSQRSWPLISHVLTDWAGWSGAEAVGMGRIVTATRILWGAIVAVLAATAWQAWRVVHRVRPTHRGRPPVAGDRPRPTTSRRRARLGAQAALGIAAVGTLVWAWQQDYLFVTSVFPAASPWLGVALGGLGAVLLASAVVPDHRHDDR